MEVATLPTWPSMTERFFEKPAVNPRAFLCIRAMAELRWSVAVKTVLIAKRPAISLGPQKHEMPRLLVGYVDGWPRHGETWPSSPLSYFLANCLNSGLRPS